MKIGFVPVDIPESTGGSIAGGTIVSLLRIVRTGKGRIARPVAVLAVQIGRTVRN